MSGNIEKQTKRDRNLMLVSGITLVANGIVHLLLLTILRFDTAAGWFSDGLWSAGPFVDNAPSLASLGSSMTFWSGIGGFPVPLVLLGALLIHFARLGVPAPDWLGWMVGLWGLVAGTLLGPSPWAVLPIVGAVIVVASRGARRPALEHA